MIDQKKEGAIKIGDGPGDLILDIPFQRAVATGTDTDAFAYSNGGVPSALISLPLRYMHTTVEMVHRETVDLRDPAQYKRWRNFFLT